VLELLRRLRAAPQAELSKSVEHERLSQASGGEIAQME
jgi:hypothetical protein